MLQASSCRTTWRQTFFGQSIAAMAALLAVASSARASECTTPTPALADDLFGAFSNALKTQHPDRVTKLFADDGALSGFASPVSRSGYMPIRDYYLYFLQFDPKARVVQRTVLTGCNYLIDEGTLVWSLKPRNGGAAETREARFRIMYEQAGGQWRIAEFADTLTGGGAVAAFAVPASSSLRAATIDPVTNTAVAGYVKRVDPQWPAGLKPSAASRNSRRIPAPDSELLGPDMFMRHQQ